MNLPVMAAAKRNGEFIADVKAECLRLRKTQVVRVGRLTSADKARLGGHET